MELVSSVWSEVYMLWFFISLVFSGLNTVVAKQILFQTKFKGNQSPESMQFVGRWSNQK